MMTHTEIHTINVTDIDEEVLNIRDTLIGAINNNTQNVKAGTIDPIIELYNSLPKQNNKPKVINTKMAKPRNCNNNNTTNINNKKILNQNIYLTDTNEDCDVDVVGTDNCTTDSLETPCDEVVSARNVRQHLTQQYVRELCETCNKYIYTHNAVVICYICSKIMHHTCIDTLLFKMCDDDGNWYCYNCQSSHAYKRYNPYDNIVNANSSDHFYDQEPIDNIDILNDMSTILNNCVNSTVNEFNAAVHKLISQDITPFSLFFNNIDGNATNFSELEIELGSYKYPFSVIAIAETNIDSVLKDNYILINYTSIYQSKISVQKHKGSGLGLYVHNNYNFVEYESVSKCTPNLETLFITITNTLKPITVGVVYRPPNGSKKAFIAEYEEILTQLPGENVFITGDFNLDLHNIDNDVSHFELTFLSAGYTPTISLVTHEQPHCRGTCIDNIFSNTYENIILSGTISEKISHHLPIYCITNSGTTGILDESYKNKGPRYDYSNVNMDNFLRVISQELAENPPYNLDFIQFTNVLKDAVDKSFITESPIQSKRTRQTNPWITNGIITSVKQKHLLYKVWKKSKTKDNKSGNIDDYIKYQKYRKTLKCSIKYVKKKYYHNQFDNVKGNLKKTWELINELRGKVKQQIKPCFIIDGTVIKNRRIIANEFNNYFVSIATKMNESSLCGDIPISPIPDFTSFTSPRVTSSIFVKDCTELEIEEIIKQFQNGKASDISIQVIKKCSAKISPHLAYYFNFFMREGIFPDILKIGKITPVYKKGDKQLFENYRPISTLPIIGKIFEKIIYSRLYNFLTSKNILYDNQFGFRKGHSTTHALNFSAESILEAIESKQHVIGIFIDLSKAFDTIDHRKLMKKLENYGIRGSCYKLLESYISNRTQYTSVLNENSDPLSVHYGVPQGSVLGPLLFLLYINDITNSTMNGNFVLYADDTNIFIVDSCRENVYVKANAMLRNIHIYMLSNQLHINMSKCNYMYFDPGKTSARTRILHKLSINGILIKQVTSIKFLGVILDDNLTWLPHINYLNNKLKTCIGVIKCIKQSIPREQYLNIYYTLFLSHLTYGISVWGGVSSTSLEPLFVTQKRCIRMLFGDEISFDHPDFYNTCARIKSYDEQMNPNYEKEHTKPLFSKNELLTIHNLYNYHIIMEVFNILKYRKPYALYEKFKFSERKELKLITHKTKHAERLQNFVCNSILKWNKLYRDLFEHVNPIEIRGLLRIVPGSVAGSDLTAKSSTIKLKLKTILLNIQNKGHDTEWDPRNFDINTHRGPNWSWGI